jgi:hypothetical protein
MAPPTLVATPSTSFNVTVHVGDGALLTDSLSATARVPVSRRRPRPLHRRHTRLHECRLRGRGQLRRNETGGAGAGLIRDHGDSTEPPESGAFVHVARGGIEPPTYRFSGGRSYQLSYLAVPHCRAQRGSKDPGESSGHRSAESAAINAGGDRSVSNPCHRRTSSWSRPSRPWRRAIRRRRRRRTRPRRLRLWRSSTAGGPRR